MVKAYFLSKRDILRMVEKETGTNLSSPTQLCKVILPNGCRMDETDTIEITIELK